jgi:ABC-type ATPase involved in cell division
VIRFDNISLRTAKEPALKHFNLTIEPGECVCFAGRRGSGKSLILALLRGDVKPAGGTVTVDQVDLSKLTPALLQLYRRNLGILLQEEQLLQDRSIASNVALGLEAKRVPMEEIALRVTKMLEAAGLIEKAAMLPVALTHGERKLVALMQALAHDPKILLVDEPLSDLDKISAATMLAMLKNALEEGATPILASRYPEAYRSLSPRIVYLDPEKVSTVSQKSNVRNISPVMG